jgi:hypothetical protein
VSAVVAALLASLVQAAPQAEAIPKLPAPVVVDRRFAPVELTLAFQLGEEHRSRLRVSFEGEPGQGEGGAASRERCTLALDFDPLDGARFSWSRSLGDAAPLRAALTNVPEPKGLDYKVRLLLHAGRGLEALLPDGAPILAATTPASGRLTISFESEGDVLGLTASAPVTVGDASVAAALAKDERPGRARPDPSPVVDPAAWSRLSPFELEGEIPSLLHVEPLDRLEVPEGVVERFELELAESERVPVLVLTPAKRDGTAALVVAGGEPGKAAPAALAQVAALAARGAVVVAFDLLGSGERRELQPCDRLEDPELLLVGDSADRRAAIEIVQLLAWAKERIDGAPAFELTVDAATTRSLARTGARFVLRALDPTELPPASASLVAAATFGEELVRRRFDSWLLTLALEKRETLSPPDRSRPLASRLVAASSPNRPVSSFVPPPGYGVTLAASDFGAKSAWHAFAPRPDLAGDSFVVLDDGPDEIGDDVALERRVGAVTSELVRIANASRGAPKTRLFGEGSCGVVMLLAAAMHPGLVESVTVSHAIPSFELLLLRPRDAVRAPPELGVLTQGMPAELFVPGALSRFEIEDCVLELRKHGVLVEWKDPVDALRRPLSRHDRLAMWPRVRREEKPR